MVSARSIVSGSFAFVRNNVPVIAVWAIVYMVGGALMSLASRPLAEAQMAMMEAGQVALPPGYLSYLVLVYLIMIATFVALFAAVYRAVLHPETSRCVYLRVSMDEARLFGLFLILIIGYFLTIIVAALAAAVIGFLVVFLAALMGAVTAGAVALILLIYGLMLAVSIWLMVRLSAAGPLTILRRRIVIREAWHLTRGRFWPLFGGYLLVAIAITAVFLCFFWLTLGSSYFSTLLASHADPAAMGAAMRSQMERAAIGRPMWFVLLIGGGTLGSVAIALYGSMTAIATRHLLDEAAD